MRNMNTGDLAVFKVNSWFSPTKGDGQLSKDVPATIKGKTQIKSKATDNEYNPAFFPTLFQLPPTKSL